MRSRTKMQWIVTWWVLVMGTVIIIGNTFMERQNADKLLLVLLGGDVLKWAVHVTGVVKENLAGVKRNDEVSKGS